MILLGGRSDWEIILQRLEALPQFCEEPTILYGLLKPVVGRFVHSFDFPTTEDTREFWQKIVHEISGIGVVRFSLFLILPRSSLLLPKSRSISSQLLAP